MRNVINELAAVFFANYSITPFEDAAKRLGYIRNKIKWHLPTLILLLALHSSFATAACPSGDINNDCVVNLLDFKILAEQWLNPDVYDY